MIYKTEDLVSSVKRRTLAPTSQKTFQDTDIISFLNEEMEIGLVPDIVSAREDFFLRPYQQPLVNGVNTYVLPERAIGNSLKDVWFVYANGVDRKNLPRLKLSDSIDFSTSSGAEPSGYYLQGDQVRVVPTPVAPTGNLEQWYLQRPSELTPTASCAKITAVSSVGGTTTFTVDTDLTGSLSTSTPVDLINASSPILLWAQDVGITTITTSTVAVSTSDVIDGSGAVLPAVGDYIAPAKKTNIAMIPEEFHPILCEMTAGRIVQALGHFDKLQAIQMKVQDMRKQAFTLISNRVESDTPTIINRNGIFSYVSSFSRASRWRF